MRTARMTCRLKAEYQVYALESPCCPVWPGTGTDWMIRGCLSCSMAVYNSHMRAMGSAMSSNKQQN